MRDKTPVMFAWDLCGKVEQVALCFPEDGVNFLSVAEKRTMLVAFVPLYDGLPLWSAVRCLFQNLRRPLIETFSRRSGLPQVPMPHVPFPRRINKPRVMRGSAPQATGGSGTLDFGGLALTVWIPNVDMVMTASGDAAIGWKRAMFPPRSLIGRSG